MKTVTQHINRSFVWSAIGALFPAIVILAICATRAKFGGEVPAKDWMVAFAGFSSIIPAMLLSSYDDKSWWRTAGAWLPTGLLVFISALGALASFSGPRLEAHSSHYDSATVLFAVIIASQAWGVCFGFAARREMGRADDAETFHKQLRRSKIAG